MGLATVLWSLAAGVSLTLAIAFASAWVMEWRNLASMMLFVLGVAVAAAAYCELGMMHAATPTEYGKWFRWVHVPVFFAFVGQVLFVHYYLRAGRLWLLWVFLSSRLVMLVVNFSTPPSIVSLHHMSLLGERVSIVGAQVPRAAWQEFAITSLLFMVYLADAMAQRWLSGGKESRRKALAVSLSIAVPWLCGAIVNQLVLLGVIHGRVSILPWLFGALLMMSYEMGRGFVRNRRALVELADLQGQLIRLERVSMLGQLVSALTHQLNQPLSANANNAAAALKQLERETPDLEELRAILGDVSSESQRIADLIVRMRELIRHRAVEMRPVGLEDVTRDVVSLVGAEVAAKQIALSFFLQPDLPNVIGDRVQLSQVLINLVMNSIQAVQCRSPEARQVVVEARADRGKGEVEMTVRDSGYGIPESIADKVFGPFFTTKPDGIGMGLALSRTIIEAHGGRLWTDQVAGQEGAIFRFTLQRA
jgi:signal transduction histidine kinase